MTQPTLNASLLKDVAASNSPLKAKGALTIIAGEHEDTLPLDLLLVLDVSGSMQGQVNKSFESQRSTSLTTSFERTIELQSSRSTTPPVCTPIGRLVQERLEPSAQAEAQTLALPSTKSFPSWAPKTAEKPRGRGFVPLRRAWKQSQRRPCPVHPRFRLHHAHHRSDQWCETRASGTNG